MRMRRVNLAQNASDVTDPRPSTTKLERVEVKNLRLLTKVDVMILDRRVRVGDRRSEALMRCLANEGADVGVIDIDTALPPEEQASRRTTICYAVVVLLVRRAARRVGSSGWVVRVDPCLIVLVARSPAREVLLRRPCVAAINGLVHAPRLIFDADERDRKTVVTGATINEYKMTGHR